MGPNEKRGRGGREMKSRKKNMKFTLEKERNIFYVEITKRRKNKIERYMHISVQIGLL